MKEKIEITAEIAESLIEKVKGEIVKKAEGLNRFELILFDFCAYEERLFKDHSGYTRSEVGKIIEGLLEEEHRKLQVLIEKSYNEHAENESQLQNEMQKIISEIQTEWIIPGHYGIGINEEDHFSLIHEVPARQNGTMQERLYVKLSDKSGCEKLYGIRDRIDREMGRFSDFQKTSREKESACSKSIKLLDSVDEPLYKGLSFKVKESKEKTQQLPKHTRKRLIEIFKEVGADISGITSIEFYYRGLNRYPRTDIYGNDKVKAHSFIYATRNSIHNNRIMQISESEVFVPINAGIAATMKFTPSSNFIRENLTKPAQLYCMHFETIHLYDTIKHEAPKGLIILSKDWIVEINYHEAPIFGDSMRTAQLATEKRRRNEIEEEIRQEEYRREEDQRRSDELDDMWDDIYLERNR